MKKLLSAILAIALMASLAACGSSSSSTPRTPTDADTSDAASTTDASLAADDTDSETEDPAIATKTLKVGMEGTYAPYTYHDDDGTLTGYEVDVATAICEELGYEVEFVEIAWDSMFEALDNGVIDVVMNQVTITEDRLASYDFTTPYIYTNPVLIVAADNEDIQTFEDIDGKRAAEGLTSNYNAIAQSYGAEIVGQDIVALALQCVINGDADCVVNDLLTYAYWTAQTGDTTSLKIVAQSDDVAESAVVLKQGREELRELLSGAIETLLEDGTIAGFSEKYFNMDISTVD